MRTWMLVVTVLVVGVGSLSACGGGGGGAGTPLVEAGSEAPGTVVVTSDPVSGDPVETEVTPGDGTQVELTFTVPYFAPEVDVVFAMDLTTSMDGELAALKTAIQDVITEIRECAPDSDVQFGLVSFEDYPGTFDSRPTCEYNREYGASTDAPFRVDAPIGSTDVEVEDAVIAMTLGEGGDAPEPYGRVFWETAQSDSGIDFRPDAAKFVVVFGDVVPHDCDIDEGLPVDCDLVGVPSATGIDPGRDATIGTADDIDFQDDAVAGMVDEDIALIFINSSDLEIHCFWEHVADQTGGTAVQINSDGTIPGATSLSDLICELLLEVSAVVDKVELVVDDDCELEITFDPICYEDVVLDPDEGATVTFVATFVVPEDANERAYECLVTALADGAVIGTETISLMPPDAPEPPEPPADPPPAKTTTVTLCAGQTIDVGTVTVTKDGEQLCVTYATKDGWVMEEVHLDIQLSADDFPTNDPGNPKVGHFAYERDDLDDSTSETFCIDLADLGIDADTESVVVAAHAEVSRPGDDDDDGDHDDDDGDDDDDDGDDDDDDEEEGAWAAACDDVGIRFNEHGSWATYFVHTLK